MLKLYKVSYEGLYMGGMAIVKAESEEEAKSMVESDERTVSFNDVSVIKLSNERGVIYNDNGDY